MKTALALIVLCTLMGCQTAMQPLYFNESTQLDSEVLAPLQLHPKTLHHDLRIDLMIDDGLVSFKKPHHPLGFDLGNGLFVDINDNLFFRLDRMMEIGEQEDYLIKYTQQEKGRVFFKRRVDDQICEEWPEEDEVTYADCKQQHHDKDVSKVFVKGELLYEVSRRSDEIHYRNADKKNTNRSTVEKINDSRYVIHKPGNQQIVQHHQDMITISGKIMLHKNPESRMLSIYTIELGDCKLLYHLQKGKNKVIIRDANFRGYLIERTANTLKVFKDGELDYELERIS
ncbi:MAG: hypothetical protein AAGG75_27085 [Bacteroidota bacterium]